ncbi:hypothetical protein V490_02248 [Pseudogymnoascus sp. VKM F-3557]|nr:hypothetical protein V490_02248 [Pseudogymnoascus sp. VKM F-3557]
MAGSSVPREPGGSPQSSKPPETTNNTETPQNAIEAAKERRKKAAAKALAEQSRLKLKSSVNKTLEVPKDIKELPKTNSTKLPHKSQSDFSAPPVNSIDTNTTLSSTAQADILSTAPHDDEDSLLETSVTNNPPQPTHTEPSESTPAATSGSPKKLSPNNYAKRGVRFEVQFLALKDETIKSDGSGYTSKKMFLEWDGIDREALTILHDNKECLFIEFGTIQRISYNPTNQHLLLTFRATTQEEPQTVVIAMKSLPTEEWVQLQQLFRQVERKWRIRCDQEDISFFEAAIKSMRMKPYVKMEFPYLKRLNAIPQKTTEKIPKALRRESVPKVSRRQSVGPNFTTTSKMPSTPKIKSERPKMHLSAEVKNIMAAKIIDQPLQIPRLSTPSKPPSVTSSLMSRTSQSPVKEEDRSPRNIFSGYGDRNSPTKRSTGSQNRNQVVQSSATLGQDDSSQGLTSLFGSDDSDHDLPNFERPHRTPSQRFKDQINKAKITSGSQPHESPKTGRGLFAQSPVSVLRDWGTNDPEKPEHEFEAFMGSSQVSTKQGSHQAQHGILASSSINMRKKRVSSLSPLKSPLSLNLTPDKLVTKRLRSTGSIEGSDRPLKKHKESHTAPENEAQLYYQCKSGQDFLLPVAVNDEVIRLRTKEEMDDSGKESKYDIFDGPWIVVGISETAFPLSSDFFVLEEEEFDAVASRQAKWNKMLTTKIRLKFPEGSKANPWVEISRVLPVIDPSHIVTGTPIASSLEVSTHPSYLKLADKLSAQGVRTLAPGSHNSFVKKGSSEITDTLGTHGPQGIQPLALNSHNSSSTESSWDAAGRELSVVEIRKGKFAVFVHIDHKGIESDVYEVAKIRQKRLRIYSKAEAKEMEVTQYDDDKWVKRLLKEHGGIVQNKIIVDEYLCSWAGWAVEDQTWVPRGNFGTDCLLRLFDEQQDPFRDIPDDKTVPVDDLVYKDDLKKAQAALRKSKRNSSGSNCQSSGGSTRNKAKKRGVARPIMKEISRSGYLMQNQESKSSVGYESLNSNKDRLAISNVVDQLSRNSNYKAPTVEDYYSSDAV